MSLLLYFSSDEASYDRYLESIIEITSDQTDKDTWQKAGNSTIKIGDEIFLYYTGNNINGDVDRIFLTRLIDGVWTKELDAGQPKVIIDKGTGWEAIQIFMRSVINNNGVIWIYYSGQDVNVSPEHSIGYATSNDGITFTKQGQIFSIAGKAVIQFAVCKLSDTNWKAIAGTTEATNVRHKYLTSSDGINWTIQTDGISALSDFRWISGIYFNSGIYYLTGWNDDGESGFGKDGTGSLMATTTDFNSFTIVGNIIDRFNPPEQGIGGSSFIKNGNNLELYYSWFTYFDKRANEPTTNVRRVIFSNTSIPTIFSIKNIYPYSITQYYPLYHEDEGTTFTELIEGTETTYSSPVWDDLKFLTCTSGPSFVQSGINQADFFIKVWIEINLSGTYQVFKIGTDIIISTVDGKLRIQLNNGTKDYISTNDITKIPITSSGNGTYAPLGFIWTGGVLKICSGFDTDFAHTKTIDDAMTDIDNNLSDVDFSDGTTLKIRSCVAGGLITETEWLQIEL